MWEYDGVKGCTKSESNGTEAEEGKPTEGVEPGESYKNYSEANGACRVWMMKVKNIRDVKLVGTEEMQRQK
ncbi:18011_t:CDS:2 [Gigaspora rosea]|nr:18011_t:CDS:2 [Gigaspora rosea]